MITIHKENIKEKIYFIEQSDHYLLWHGTLDELKDSLLGNLRILEYSQTADIPRGE